MTSHILEYWRVYLQYCMTLKVKEAQVIVIYRLLVFKKKKREKENTKRTKKWHTHILGENTKLEVLECGSRFWFSALF